MQVLSREYLDWLYSVGTIESTYDVEYADLSQEEIKKRLALSELFEELLEQTMPYDYESIQGIMYEAIYFRYHDKCFKITSCQFLGMDNSLEEIEFSEDIPHVQLEE